MYDYSFRLDDGYAARAPSAEAAEINREIAEAELCPMCTGPMVYQPRHNANNGSYIAEAVCIRCHYVIEF